MRDNKWKMTQKRVSYLNRRLMKTTQYGKYLLKESDVAINIIVLYKRKKGYEKM